MRDSETLRKRDSEEKETMKDDWPEGHSTTRDLNQVSARAFPSQRQWMRYVEERQRPEKQDFPALGDLF